MAQRGRPKEKPAVVSPTRKLEATEYVNPKYHDKGWIDTHYYSLVKNPNGAYKVTMKYPKTDKAPKVKPQKGKPYNSTPVVMVFKTSNRSNAKTKMKVWKNQNIDYIMSAPSLPGVPDKAIVLELGAGESFIKMYKSQYNL